MRPTFRDVTVAWMLEIGDGNCGCCPISSQPCFHKDLPLVLAIGNGRKRVEVKLSALRIVQRLAAAALADFLHIVGFGVQAHLMSKQCLQ